MNWLRKRIVEWLNRAPSGPECEVVSTGSSTIDGTPNPGDFNLSVMHAMNGKVIQIRTYTPHAGLGPDWRTDLFLVTEGEKMTEALATLMILKNLEKA